MYNRWVSNGVVVPFDSLSLSADIVATSFATSPAGINEILC